MRASACLVRCPACALVVIALAGCTSMSGLSGSSSYACKAPEGVTCQSMSGTYANAVQNKLPSQRRQTAQTAQDAPLAASDGPRSALPAQAASGTSARLVGLPPTPVQLRSMPRILRLWFKPWEDADHDLYDQGYVYVQIDSGQWQVEHVQQQIRDVHAPLKAPARTTRSGGKDDATSPANGKNAGRSTGDASSPGPQAPAVPIPRGGDSTE